ncbi:MAG: hypothetical protein GC164_05740 [Phycisphaera sp.]|nr:hypothetical protein [Phycisphaera sp.]
MPFVVDDDQTTDHDRGASDARASDLPNPLGQPIPRAQAIQRVSLSTAAYIALRFSGQPVVLLARAAALRALGESDEPTVRVIELNDYKPPEGELADKGVPSLKLPGWLEDWDAELTRQERDAGDREHSLDKSRQQRAQLLDSLKSWLERDKIEPANNTQPPEPPETPAPLPLPVE